MQANIKIKNSKNLKVKALVDSGYTHTRMINNWSRRTEYK